jgi:hypothetical protein
MTILDQSHSKVIMETLAPLADYLNVPQRVISALGSSVPQEINSCTELRWISNICCNYRCWILYIFLDVDGSCSACLPMMLLHHESTKEITRPITSFVNVFISFIEFFPGNLAFNFGHCHSILSVVYAM